MNSSTTERLLELNRRFYVERGRDFSETRLRVQPGVRRVLENLRGNESVLDLGCGNGAFARELSQHGHCGPYLGLDFSIPLLEHARRVSYAFPVRFIQTDLMLLARAPSGIHGEAEGLPSDDLNPPKSEAWPLITAFAVLHHIPGGDHRLALLARIRGWLRTDGLFIHSNWQFSSSRRLQSRIRPWSSVELDANDMDEGDYLLDWRRGGNGFRYVHEFTEDELADLASKSGFVVTETFYSDGADRRSGLYQVWQPV